MPSNQLPDDLDYAIGIRSGRSSNWSFLAIVVFSLVAMASSVYTVFDRGGHAAGDSTAQSARLAQLESDQAKVKVEVASLTQQNSALAARIQALEGKSAGEVKKIDGLPKGEFRTYTVLEGDTLRKIAIKMYGTSAQSKKIYEANRDQLKTPSSLSSGMVLQIPK